LIFADKVIDMLHIPIVQRLHSDFKNIIASAPLIKARFNLYF